MLKWAQKFLRFSLWVAYCDLRRMRFLRVVFNIFLFVSLEERKEVGVEGRRQQIFFGIELGLCLLTTTIMRWMMFSFFFGAVSKIRINNSSDRIQRKKKPLRMKSILKVASKWNYITAFNLKMIFFLFFFVVIFLGV